MSSVEVKVCDVYDAEKLKIDTREDGENWHVVQQYVRTRSVLLRIALWFVYACMWRVPASNGLLLIAAAELVKAIEECEGLETLNLSGKSFGVEASQAIGEALKYKPSLKYALWSDMFVSKLKTEIPQALVS